MKKLNVLITVIIALAIVGCASVEHEKGEAMELVYETDFSSDDGAFERGGGEINEIEKGVLHLKKGTADEPAWARLDRVYGNNSTTTFRIKFGEPVFTHIDFLQGEGGNRFLLHFSEKRLHFVSFFDREETSEYHRKVNLTSGRQYDVAVSIIDYNVTVSIDGVQMETVTIDNRLPAEGIMSFGCHEDEFWVDDLRVVAAKAEGVVERKPEEKTAEREAEKVEVQRALSDSRIAVVGIKTEDDQEKTAAA